MENIIIKYVLITTAFSGAGLLLDKLLRPHQAEKLRKKLEVWWKVIEGLKIRDLTKVMANYFLSLMKFLFGNKNQKVNFGLRTLIFSCIWTIIAIFLGELYKNTVVSNHYSTGFFENITYSFAWIFSHKLQFLLPINYILDTLTIVVTFYFVVHIAKAKNNLMRIAYIFLDVMIAFILGAICFILGDYIEFSFFEPHEKYLLYLSGFKEFSSFPDYAIGNFFYANSTFAPTFIYLTILACLSVSLIVFKLVKMILKHLFHLTLETDKSIFYHTGNFFALINIIVQLLIDLK